MLGIQEAIYEEDKQIKDNVANSHTDTGEVDISSHTKTTYRETLQWLIKTLPYVTLSITTLSFLLNPEEVQVM